MYVRKKSVPPFGTEESTNSNPIMTYARLRSGTTDSRDSPVPIRPVIQETTNDQGQLVPGTV